MTKNEIADRRRFLRRQANDLKIQEALLKIREYYAGLIGKRFDPVLSSKIDCLTYLIEN